MGRHAVQGAGAARKETVKFRRRCPLGVLRRAMYLQAVARQQGKGMGFACINLRFSKRAAALGGRIDEYQQAIAFRCSSVAATILCAHVDGRCLWQTRARKNIAEFTRIVRLKKHIVSIERKSFSGCVYAPGKRR
jgi:hypothetical protein